MDMGRAIRYVVASTERRLAAAGWERAWVPAGQKHAYCLTRGSRPTVSMCGLDTESLYVFDPEPFVAPWTGDECPECRRWVMATSAIGA
jgi:hypothetical protein